MRTRRIPSIPIPRPDLDHFVLDDWHSLGHPLNRVHLITRHAKSMLMLYVLSFLVTSTNGGTITGYVPLAPQRKNAIPIEKYRGKISGKVTAPPAPIAGVWLEGPNLRPPASPPRVSLPQINYQFGRSLLVVPTGTTVAFPNNDSDYHNIYSLSRAKRFDLGRYKKDENPAPTVLFDKAGFVSLRCEIHEHMNANLIVVNSPYFGVTNTKGFFTLKNIPAGNYTLHAQLDRKTRWKQAVRVVGKQTTKVTLQTK